MQRKLSRVLIANRGEIAVRIMRACKKMGISTLIIYSTADRDSAAVRAADEAIEIGPPEPASSYLNIEKIVAICKEHRVDGVHPGYGFLSENEAFAAALELAGIVFIGPTSQTIGAMGDKIAARRIAERSGVPVVPGYAGEDMSEATLASKAAAIGYPVLIKASRGGGGRGMRRVDTPEAFSAALASAQREAASAFGNDSVFLEKYVLQPRHIEIQVLGDHHGNLVHLFERDCSIQRRHQKIIEESPSPALTPERRSAIAEAALKVARAVNYANAGTVEFIYSDATKDFYFLEMNTRLQVEHPVTEAVTGLDLVAEQLLVASGAPLSFRQEDLLQRGHAVEVRLYAENPWDGFLPTSGKIHRFDYPQSGLRVDSGYESGDQISIYYDSMIAKIIAHADTREHTLDAMSKALGQDIIFFGPGTNLEYLRSIMLHPVFRSGKYTTAFIEESMQKRSISPDEAEAARTIAGLLHLHAAGNIPVKKSQTVARSGGELWPWTHLTDFELWR